MAMLYTILVLGLSLCGLGLGAYITELTDNNFYDYAKEKDILLVDFYAPWCSDCKKLDPEFDKAAQVLDARSMDLAKVDCFGAGSGLCQMYSVRSWPQLKTFRKGTYLGEYQGVQTGDSMALYVESLAGQQTQSAEAQVANSPNLNQAPYSYIVPADTTSTATEGKTKGKAEKGAAETKTHAKAIIHKRRKHKQSNEKKTKHFAKKVASEPSVHDKKASEHKGTKDPSEVEKKEGENKAIKDASLVAGKQKEEHKATKDASLDTRKEKEEHKDTKDASLVAGKEKEEHKDTKDASLVAGKEEASKHEEKVEVQPQQKTNSDEKKNASILQKVVKNAKQIKTVGSSSATAADSKVADKTTTVTKQHSP